MPKQTPREEIEKILADKKAARAREHETARAAENRSRADQASVRIQAKQETALRFRELEEIRARFLPYAEAYGYKITRPKFGGSNTPYFIIKRKEWLAVPRIKGARRIKIEHRLDGFRAQHELFFCPRSRGDWNDLRLTDWYLIKDPSRQFQKEEFLDALRGEFAELLENDRKIGLGRTLVVAFAIAAVLGISKCKAGAEEIPKQPNDVQPNNIASGLTMER